MLTHLRGSVALIAIGLLVSCGSSSIETSSAAGVNSCVPLTFQCDGDTPGFWTSVNGCVADPGVLTGLNAFLAQHGFVEEVSEVFVPFVVDDCPELDTILKEDATDMSLKLRAAWIAFVLSFEDDGCGGQPLQFFFDSTQWLPGESSAACESAVDALFASEVLTLDDFAPVVKTLLESGTPCEQETLKNFFDAANNDARVCACDCLTGGNGGTSGAFNQ